MTEETSAIVERYRKLVVAMNELSTMMDIKQIGEFVVSTAKALVDAEMAWMFVPDHSNQTLTLEAATLPPGIAAPVNSISIKDSLEGWVFVQQHPLTINDVQMIDPEKGNMIILAGNPTRSTLIMPAVFLGSTIFVLEVVNKRAGDFSETDQELLEYFCKHTTISLSRLSQSSQSDLIPELVHELRTPLAALNTALQLLLRTDLPGKKREHITHMIQSEFNRLADLTSSFLDYSRLKSGKEKYKFSLFDLNQLIHDSLDLMQSQFDYKKMKLSLELPAQPVYLWADRDKMKQVFLNLLSNAVKYNQDGSSVLIMAEASPQFITFSLSDEGQGIPMESLPRLFQRFYRLPSSEGQIKGTGLGLAICKQIVEAHHGRIEVSSTIGQGSTFTVQLPAVPEKLTLQI